MWPNGRSRRIDDLPISRSYASNLKAGRKSNLGSAKLFEIADFLTIRIEDLWLPPPTGDMVDLKMRYSPEAIAALVRAAAEPPVKRKRRRSKSEMAHPN